MKRKVVDKTSTDEKQYQDAMQSHRQLLAAEYVRVQNDRVKSVQKLATASLGASVALFNPILNRINALACSAWTLWIVAIAATLLSDYLSEKAIENELASINSGDGSDASVKKLNRAIGWTNGLAAFFFLAGIVVFLIFLSCYRM